MRVFLPALALLVVSLLAHVLLWRVRLPKHHTATLLAIFSAALVSWIGLSILLKVPPSDALRAAVLFGSVSLCYVITYSAVEGDSPTLSLMQFLAESGDRGSSREEVEAFFAKRPFIRTRLRGLLDSSLIEERDGRYCGLGKPPLAFRLILGFRRIYGTIPGGG